MSSLDTISKNTPTTFKECVDHVIDTEGGDKVVGHPDDPGGITKYGIASKFYPNLDIANLTREEAELIYRANYWDKYRIESLPEHLRYTYFDMVVNPGPRGAGKILQKTINYFLKRQDRSLLKVDGMVGPNTLKNLATVDIDIGKFRSYRILYYAERIITKPAKESFMEGWFNRAINI